MSMDGLDLTESEEVEVSEPIQQSVTDSAIQKKERLVKVGSSGFYGGSQEESDEELEEESDEDDMEIRPEEQIATVEEEVRMPAPRKPPHTLSDFKKTNHVQVARTSSDIVRPQPPHKPTPTQQPAMGGRGSRYDIKKSFEEFMDPEKEEKFERMFNSTTPKLSRSETASRRPQPASRGERSLLFIFIILMLLITAENESKKVDFTVEADAALQTEDLENLKVPARLLSKEGELTLSSASTGVSESAGQKARGKIVIYNEYSSASQSLVASTRFETGDGKIFRLVEGVVVPGTTNVAGEANPGAIEVEVIADMPGEQYNVGPTSFTIPGFRGGDKYAKIYAKSSEPMLGGGSSADAAKLVAQSDIDGAKNKTEDSIREKMVESVKSELAQGEMILEEASEFEIIESVPLAKSGDLRNEFDYQVRAKANFLIFSENQIREIAEKLYKDRNKRDFAYSISEVVISYSGAEVDLEGSKADIKVSAQVTSKPSFDADAFKKQLISKDEDEIRMILKGYPYVKNLEISVQPEFVSTTPKLGRRIMLEVKDYESK